MARRLIGRGNVRPALNVLDACMDHTRALAAGGALDPATVGELNTLAETVRDLVTA